jgi:DNA replication protein DnaC
MTVVAREIDLEQALQELRLVRAAAILKETLRVCQHESWSYKRLLRELVEQELAYRRQRALELRIERADIPEGWTLETFPFHLQPGVDRVRINELADLDFLRGGMNIVFIAKTGRGKTGLATSLLLKALLNGYTGLRRRVQDVLDDLHRSIADRRTKHVLNRLSRLDLLVADEMGYLCLNEDQGNLFFKLMDNRYRARKSTVITTNLGYDDWGSFLKNPAMTEALLSRLRQRCVTIEIEGPDLRALKDTDA